MNTDIHTLNELHSGIHVLRRVEYCYTCIRRIEYWYTYKRRVLNTGIHVSDILRTGIHILDALNTISQAIFPRIYIYTVSNLYKNIIMQMHIYLSVRSSSVLKVTLCSRTMYTA